MSAHLKIVPAAPMTDPPAGRMSKAARLDALKAPMLRLADRLAETGRKRREIDERTAPKGRAERRRARFESRAPITARDTTVQPVTRTVEDPYDHSRVRVALNRRVDILEQDRRNLSVAAFAVGRDIQAVFERADRLNLPARSWGGGDRVDAAAAHETAIGKAVEAAMAKRAIQAELERVHGTMGARFFLRVLLEAESYAAFAERTIGGGERRTASVASRFRAMLEELTEARGQAVAVGAGGGGIRAARNIGNGE